MKLRVGRDGSYVAVLSTTRQEPGKTRRIFQSFLELVMGGRQIMGRHRSLLVFFSYVGTSMNRNLTQKMVRAKKKGV